MTKKTRRRIGAGLKPPIGVVGAKIRAYRVQQNMLQRDLAKLLDLPQSTISDWETGNIPTRSYAKTKEKFEELMALIGIDQEPREETPRLVPPVPTTTGLRVALSTPEDDFAYSPRKILHSIQYLEQNIPRLLERLEKSAREIQHLEQSQGITQEQLAVLREKARDYDRLQEIMGKKLK